MVIRHDKCEQEEKKRFLSFLKVPTGYGRNRSHKRTDSRAESSGANTPDPMSPHNVDHQDSTNSPITSPPATPLPMQIDENNPLSSVAVMRRRTMSQSRFHKERESKEDCPNNLQDIVEVICFIKKIFSANVTLIFLINKLLNIYPILCYHISPFTVTMSKIKKKCISKC